MTLKPQAGDHHHCIDVERASAQRGMQLTIVKSEEYYNSIQHHTDADFAPLLSRSVTVSLDQRQQ
jgi:hypothetical protein